MVLYLVGMALATSSAGEPQVDYDARVREFVQKAASGLGGPIGQVAANLEIRPNESVAARPNQKIFEFKTPGLTTYGDIVVDEAGQIWGYNDRTWGDRTWDEGSALKLDTIEQLAREYYEAAGFAGVIKLHAVTPRHGPSYLLDFLPTHQGVPFHRAHNVLMWIDHRTGRLAEFLRRKPCTPPESLEPNVDLPTARARMMSHLFTIRPLLARVREHYPVQLTIWKPEASGPYDYLTPEQRQLGQSGHGILVYWTWVFDDEHSDLARPGPGYEIVLDAVSGRVLYVGANEGGYGSGAAAEAAKPLASSLNAG
jgi:hypothetical protein